MSENPYAPPAAEIEAPASGPIDGTGDFSIGRCLSDAWAATWANFPLWLGVGIVGLLALLGSGITIIGIFLVWPVLAYGGALFLLRVHDGNADFSDIWAGFQNYLSILASGVVMGILMTLVSYVGQIPAFVGGLTGSVSITIIGQLVSLVWTFVVVRFYFAFFLWVEFDIRPVEAFARSWRMTAPVKWKMIGLLLLMMTVLFVSIIPVVAVFIPAIASEFIPLIGLGFLLAVMLIPAASMVSYLLIVSAYRQMVGRPEVSH